ncbi:hypothetical protein L211DRAFT_870851 [Terfezia boudieri ATCC MYA-4762]|uniref:Uncharacterized protein n=1 Tax=Terfezia boudieri ATCC MYA-4762 TaxID=1051890 RepID=A0A3N4LHF8_9PEZI|nr:hypothetical protein L211DRAFT_870851 [Terfezia boudieri ATCC MYA-4762]
MEASPLTQAHNHVTKAAQLTSSGSAHNLTPEILKEASKEHSLAADLFEKAGDLTTDPEAQRTLCLMKGHHRKLSQALTEAAAIKTSSKSSAVGGNGTGTPILIRSGSPGPMAHSETPTLRRAGSSNAEPDLSPQGFPPLSHPLSNTSRLGKSTPSLLVSNLASKRGIPPMQSVLTPVLSPATTPGASARRGNDFFTSNQLNQHLDAQRGPNAGVSGSKTRRGVEQVSRDSNKQGEAGFNKFYTSLETFVSRIGSPLAGPLGFAGMDLKPESKETSISSPTTDGELIDGSTVPAHPDKDGYSYGYGVTEMVQNLMPKAWWSGQDQGQAKPNVKARGIFGAANGGRSARPGWQGNESYYVVPTTKGDKTFPVSYAAVAGRAPSPPQEVSEDFSPLRPKKTDGGRRTRATADISITETIPEGDESKADLDQGKTMEELMLENQQLRQATDNLSRRLHTWEVNARDSRAMLDRSLMLYRNKPGSEGGSFGSVGDDRTADREKELQMEIRSLSGKVVELEAELEQLKLELDREKKENERSTKKANYYKERWDKLKMDARAKELRKQQGGGGAMPTVGEATPRSWGSRRASLETL